MLETQVTLATDSGRLAGYSEVIGCWSALADDFRTFLLLALIVMN
jgi:hypothetical protein